MKRKIKSLEEIASALALLRADQKKIVHCHGVFDLMHVGHIRHFEQAKRLGDVLVVSVTQDRYVNKGPHRPIFDEQLRAEAIASLECVDFVAVNRWPTAVETIQLLRPDFYVKGSDYREVNQDRTGGIAKEEAAVSAVGGRLMFTDDITFSSSKLINRFMQPFSPEVMDYLTDFRARHTAAEVIGVLERLRPLRVLVVGEAIIDEYSYCTAIGKSSKEPIVVVRHSNSEKFAGGVLAIANHLASFCDQVGVLSILGEQNSHREFIEEKLSPAIQRLFLTRKNAPTILKRRFVDDYYFQKHLEVYEMNDAPLASDESACLGDALRAKLKDFDVIVVADYGHGMLNKESVDLLVRHAPFLAVNTQCNAGNMGYHTISKYPRADYVCIAANEAMLEMRDRNCDLREVIKKIAEQLRCPQMTVTQGKSGCLCYRVQEGVAHTPSLASQVVDRIGGGDAVFAVTSPCAFLGTAVDVLGFIGNAVGALAVATVCNQRPIEQIALYRLIESILK